MQGALPEPTLSYSLSFERLRPIYHVMPVNGWQNDPNGPVFFGCAAPVRPACPCLDHAATPHPTRPWGSLAEDHGAGAAATTTCSTSTILFAGTGET